MSRLWKVGSIYSRLSGMVEGGHLKSADIPIWYAIYKRFPPVREPRYLTLTEGDVPKAYEPPKILYDEDVVRQAYYEDVDDGEIIKLKNNDRKARSQVFIDEYFLLKAKQKTPVSHLKLFRQTLEHLQQHGHPIMFRMEMENKYPELEAQSSDSLAAAEVNTRRTTPTDGEQNDAALDKDSHETDWERNQAEGHFPLSKNTYQYRRLQPQRIQTSFGERAVVDSNVVHRRTDGYMHSTVRGDEVKQTENPYMPGERVQPLTPPSFIQQNMLRHGKVHNVFTREQHEQDPFLRLQDRVKNVDHWKKPPVHDKVYTRKFRAKKFLVDIPGIYDKK